MSMAPQAITHPVIVTLVRRADSARVAAELRYDPTDPYAVAVAFGPGDREVVWLFGRELLMHGLCEPAGSGDVHVFPSLDEDGRAVVLVELYGAGGRALVQIPLRDVLDFLACAAKAVWPGTEGDHISADAAITEILVRG